MTLPSSPPLSLTQILTELGRLEVGQSLSGAADERSLSDVASGSIRFSDYLGKSVSVPGSQTFNSSGNFTVPLYTSLTVTCYGSGGGGGGSVITDGAPECNVGGSGTPGGTGGYARFAYGAVQGNGGGGGSGHQIGHGDDTVNGFSGGGSGGSVVIGGGAAGGAGSTSNSSASGGNGGPGGRTSRTFTVSDGPSVGAVIAITVQNGGAAGTGDGGSPCGRGTPPAPGSKGHVTITWT